MADEFKFQYMPLDGRLPGRDFEKQTEDVINDLGRRIVTVEVESGDASELAKEAYDKAVEAASTADAASATAQNAQATADDAVKQAENAQAAATAATDTANDALTAANNAQAAAENANTTANAAENAANEALDTANNASETAQNAQNTAETANNIAIEAMEVAEAFSMYQCIGFEEDDDDTGDAAIDLDDYYEFARLHTAASVVNTPLEGTEFFIDVDVNSLENKVRQMATTVDGTTTYIRWGTIEEDEETEEKTVTWGAWAQSTGGGSSLTEIIGLTPNYYKRASLFGTAATSITVYANTQVNIGNKGYVSTVDTVLQLDDVATAANRAGKDVYIYAVQGSGTEPNFVLSLNSTVPDGYTADNSRKIGGFHCECNSVGTISGHTYSGLNTGDVIDISAWDLLHRANSENEGMVWIAGLGAWFDIYMTSYDGSQVASAYGAEICNGYSTEPFNGDKFVEQAGLVGKRLTTRDEFIVYAKGSNETTNIEGSASGVTAGGHVDTDGRRMISNYALEECCGHFWQWNKDQYGGFTYQAGSSYTTAIGQYGGADNNGANYYLVGFGWDRNYNSTGTSRLADPDVDGSTSLYGDCYGVVARFLSGGHWDNGVGCGSRSVALYSLSARRHSIYAGRLASEPRAVAL